MANKRVRTSEPPVLVRVEGDRTRVEANFISTTPIGQLQPTSATTKRPTHPLVARARQQIKEATPGPTSTKNSTDTNMHARPIAIAAAAAVTNRSTMNQLQTLISASTPMSTVIPHMTRPLTTQSAQSQSVIMVRLGGVLLNDNCQSQSNHQRHQPFSGQQKRGGWIPKSQRSHPQQQRPYHSNQYHQPHQQQRTQPTQQSQTSRGRSGPYGVPQQQYEQRRPFSTESHSTHAQHHQTTNPSQRNGFRSQQPRRPKPEHQSHDQQFRSYPRHWVNAAPTSSTAASNKSSIGQSTSSSLNYTLACYNILCGAYIEKSYFPKTPHWLLNDTYRRRTIAQQFTSHDHPLSEPDLISLQEVDEFHSFWRPTLSQHGYDSVFKARTATQSERADGLALFWKKETFQFVKRLDIEYAIWPTTDRKDNIGVGVLLQCKSLAPSLISSHAAASSSSSSSISPRYVALVNTHLLFNPRRGELKIGQTQILMNSIDAWLNQFCREQVKKTGVVPNISIVLTGDFNSTTTSTINQFILQGELNLESDTAYACMANPSLRILNRYQVDGTELYRYEAALKEEQARELTSTQSATTLVSSSPQLFSPTLSTSGKKRRRELEVHGEEKEDESDLDLDEEDEDDDLLHDYEEAVATVQQYALSSSSTITSGVPLPVTTTAAIHRQTKITKLGTSSTSSFPVSYPSTGRQTRSVDAITAFFPFHPHDTPTHIHHDLKLVATHVDPALFRTREKSKQPGLDQTSSSAIHVPSLDPLTGLPIRLRPTSYHARGAMQVDQIYVSSQPYQYHPELWEKNSTFGATPKEVMWNKLQQANTNANAMELDEDDEDEQNNHPVIDLTDENESQFSTLSGGLELTGLLEFPSTEAFLPHKVSKMITHYQTQRLTSTTPTTSPSTMPLSTVPNDSSVPPSAAADGPPPFSTTRVAQLVTVEVDEHDSGLPVPDCPSDHFPIAIRFKIN